MRKFTGFAALVAACGLAPAQASCWSPAEVAAAQVRDMQSMLMVAALRCRAGGLDILADYNRFVRVNRATIEAMNDRIKARFRADSGADEGQRRYDRFTTQLANAYGSGRTDARACAEAANIARQASLDGGTAEDLVASARQAVFATPIPEAVCTLPAEIIADGTPPAPRDPVVLAAVDGGK